MSSQPSSTNGDVKDKNSISLTNQEVSNYNDSTSYKGMKTETEISGKSLKSDTMSGTSDKATDQETVASQEKKVSVKFEYKLKANKVLMTGSFLNWNTFIEMNKNSRTGFFEFNINLPRGIYQFKFTVDGSWTISNCYHTIRDSNDNLNNQIDTTNFPDIKEEVISKKKEIKSKITE